MPSTGGLATGLKGPHERSGGIWIGWPGDVSRFSSAQREELDRRLRDLRAVPIQLSPGEVARYYEGFANGVLWPLFHYLLDHVPRESRDWETYRRVNARFTDLVVEQYRPGDHVWVQDYQLLLVPGMLRERLPDARIGFFLHIPFPSVEVFRTLPWRAELLRGVLGADLVGFHTPGFLREFAASVRQILGAEADGETCRFGNRQVCLDVFPMGIDAPAFAARVEEPEVIAEVQALRTAVPGGRIVVGVDRLDYTKGIPRRLLAFDRMLEQEPSLRGRVRLIQVAVPSREGVEAYRTLRDEVEGLVGRINGARATLAAVPIHYMYRGLSQRQLIALYRAADVMMVTPLRDGMNLVAKEFVAARTDDDGVLLLSEFAGAAVEMGDAVVVNPYDITGVADALHRALAMPEAERHARMRSLRRGVFEHDVTRWAARLLTALAACGAVDAGDDGPVVTPQPEAAALAARLRDASRLVLLLDYDGTLVPFAERPELATPDADLLALLRALASRPDTDVHVVSGRPREVLERWLGTLPIGLHAEHGFFSRAAPDQPWVPAREVAGTWKEAFRPLLREYVVRCAGALMEEKYTSLAWHYRAAEAAEGERYATALRHGLEPMLLDSPCEVLLGQKVIEVRLRGIHKGLVVPGVTAGGACTVAALGDDNTDEDLFAALPTGSVAVHVGPRPSRAPWRLRDPAAARGFLRSLLAHPERVG